MFNRRELKLDKTNEDLNLLPPSYISLLELFTYLDLSSNILLNKNETIYLTSITIMIKSRINKKFGEYEFGQILTVFSDSYYYEKVIKNQGLVSACDKYDWKLLPNIMIGSQSDESPRKRLNCLSLGQLLYRKNQFFTNLSDIYQETHKYDVPSLFLDPSSKIIFTTPIKNHLFRRPSFKTLCKNLFESPDTITPKTFTQSTLNLPSTSVAPTCKTSAPKLTIDSPQYHNKVKALPIHLRRIYDNFCLMDIHLRSKNQSSMDDLSKNMNLSLDDVGKILKIYPSSFHWEWKFRSNSKLYRDHYVLMIRPNLQEDETNLSKMDSKKCLQVFSHQRITQRKLVFLNKCDSYVGEIFQRFMDKYNSDPDNDLYMHFNVNLHVPLIQPVSPSIKPNTNPIINSHNIIKSKLFFSNFKNTKLSVLDKIRIRKDRKQSQKSNVENLSKIIETIVSVIKSEGKLQYTTYIERLLYQTKLERDNLIEILKVLDQIAPGYIKNKNGVVSCSTKIPLSRIKKRIDKVMKKNITPIF